MTHRNLARRGIGTAGCRGARLRRLAGRTVPAVLALAATSAASAFAAPPAALVALAAGTRVVAGHRGRAGGRGVAELGKKAVQALLGIVAQTAGDGGGVQELMPRQTAAAVGVGRLHGGAAVVRQRRDGFAVVVAAAASSPSASASAAAASRRTPVARWTRAGTFLHAPNLAAGSPRLNLWRASGSPAAPAGTLRRVRRTIVLGAAAAAFALGASLAPVHGAETRIERSAEFQGRVNSAIDQGVEWLRSVQRPGGAFPDYTAYPGGVTALAYQTLRVCGVQKSQPLAATTFDAMRRLYESCKRRSRDGVDLRTYSAALFAMALAEHGEASGAADTTGERLTQLSPEDAAWMRELVKFLEDGQDSQGRWSYPYPNRMANAYDNSNTQYALLGLKAASRAGAKVRPSTWSRALRHLLNAQEDDGPDVRRRETIVRGRTTSHPMDRARGWNYSSASRDDAYGSMTAGGAGSVVICRSELLGDREYTSSLDARAEQSVRDGIAWLGKNFSVATNPGTGNNPMAGPAWHYYYLYALERAGVLAGVEWMADRDWYGEGAEYLLRAQRTNGAWTQNAGGGPRAVPAADDYDAVTTTCFALLFLKRGTARVARGALTKSFDETDINFGTAAALGGGDFEDFLDLVLSRWRRIPETDAKERLLARATAVGPRIVAPLILRLDSTKGAEREAAFTLLRRATGLDHGYLPAAGAGERETALAAWQSWWLAGEKTARYDAASGRIVIDR